MQLETITKHIGLILVAIGLVGTWVLNDYRIDQLEMEVAAINPVVLEVRERLVSIETKLEFIIQD